MDYRLLGKKDLNGRTDVIEIGKGVYDFDACYSGDLYVCEEAFLRARAPIEIHFPYDHYDSNPIPNSIARSIVKEWRSFAAIIEISTGSEIRELLQFRKTRQLEKHLFEERESIANMLCELADCVESLLSDGSDITILGI